MSRVLGATPASPDRVGAAGVVDAVPDRPGSRGRSGQPIDNGSPMRAKQSAMFAPMNWSFTDAAVSAMSTS